jgi:molecular chaperone GrpE
MRSAQAGEEFQDEAGEGRPEQEGMSPDNNGWDNALRDEALMPEDAGAAADQAQADAEARLKAEVEELRLRAAENVLSDLLPTLDNLDLALQYGSKHEACKDMLQGVAMTRKLLREAVTKHGLTPLGEEGEEFNPEVHEAVGFDARPDLASGAVARVLQRGYKLGDRLLRPAKVMINQ